MAMIVIDDGFIGIIVTGRSQRRFIVIVRWHKWASIRCWTSGAGATTVVMVIHICGTIVVVAIKTMTNSFATITFIFMLRYNHIFFFLFSGSIQHLQSHTPFHVAHSAKVFVVIPVESFASSAMCHKLTVVLIGDKVRLCIGMSAMSLQWGRGVCIAPKMPTDERVVKP